MAGHRDADGDCHGCGGEVDLETGVEIRIRRGRTEIRRQFCEECATVGCKHCGIDLPVRSLLADRPPSRAQRIECTRCEETVPVGEAVEIRHAANRRYRKRVCGDCLDEIAIPPDFKVRRELSPTSR